MCIRYTAAAFLLSLFASACVPTVTGDDIDRELERQLRSVEGPWTGMSYGNNLLTLSFQLQQGAGTAVSGSGTMKEGSASAAVPITVTGTFAWPNLSLTFNGMLFEGQAVQGAFQGSYSTICPMEVLHLTGVGYTRDIQVMLCEEY